MRPISLPPIFLIALMAATLLAVAAPPGGAPIVLADDRGKQSTDKQATDKSKQEGVPAQCARLIKASERQRCLRKSGS